MAGPALRSLADAILDDGDQRLWLLAFTARQFGADPFDPEGIGVGAIPPQFFGDEHRSDALAAARGWTATCGRHSPASTPASRPATWPACRCR